MTEYTPQSRNKCLYCQTTVKFEPARIDSSNHSEDGKNYTFYRTTTPQEIMWTVAAMCPHCLRTILTLHDVEVSPDGAVSTSNERIIWPQSSGRPPAPQELPPHLANDYNESALVLPFSPKASAALSRRCLQVLLGEAAGTKSKNLSEQIDELLISKSLPSHIGENLDVVRNIGNFAAHEQKSTSSGVILDVEPGEAEWNLDVLDSLFDFYYVRPAIEKKKRDDLNKKLKDAGKPEMKQP